MAHRRSFGLYAPPRRKIVRVARTAPLVNRRTGARPDLLRKLTSDLGDFDDRDDRTVPGLVYGVESDTCMTGREQAPENIAYDEYGAEFVFRQPRNDAELVAVMSADTVEVYSCYRFDGLEHWTPALVADWVATSPDLVARLQTIVMTESDPDIFEGARAYLAYLSGDEFQCYIAALLAHIEMPP